MNKNLFKQILKQTISRIEESFDNVEFEEIDTSKFRYKNDESYRVSVDGEFSLQIDYNLSNEDGSIKNVSDRSVSFYLTRYQDTNYHAGKDSVFRTIHAYKNDSWRTYDTTMMITVHVNGNAVAEFSKDVDLLDGQDKPSLDIGNDFFNAIFRP